MESPTLHISLLNDFGASISGAPLDLSKAKPQAVLCLLAMAPSLRCRREFVRGVLWPNADETAAQTSLRNALWSLKKAFDPISFAGFGANRREIWLDPQQVQTDLDGVLLSCQSGTLPADIAVNPQFSRTMLHGLIGITDLMDDRIQEFRKQIENSVRVHVERLAQQDTDLKRRISALQFLGTMDPLDEGTSRQLIECFRDDGQIANALETYQSLWNQLESEFGEEPSQKTQNLIVEIKQGSIVETEASERPKILMHPMDTSHLDQQTERKALAIRDRLKANLARFREWQIIDCAVIYPEAIRVLSQSKGAYSLDLGAYTERDVADFEAVLTHLGTGEVLWSEAYSDPLITIGREQPNIVRRLSVALNVHLSSYRLNRRAAGLETQDQYDRWLEAQDLITQFKPEGWRRAEKLLDDLIMDHPEFSRAYSSRASIENMRHISFPGLYSSPGLHSRALKLATRAIELDPMDSRGQLAMGWSCAMSRQFDKAELAFELAFQYNENDPWTISSSAVGLAFCNHTDAANSLVNLLCNIGFVLQPSHWSYMAATNFLSGDFEACIEASEKSDEISHDVPAWHAAALALVGRREQAAEVAKRFAHNIRKNWVAEGPSQPSEITRWLVNGFPIRSRQSWLALRDGLRLAGLEVPDLVELNREFFAYQP